MALFHAAMTDPQIAQVVNSVTKGIDSLTKSIFHHIPYWRRAAAWLDESFQKTVTLSKTEAERLQNNLELVRAELNRLEEQIDEQNTRKHYAGFIKQSRTKLRSLDKLLCTVLVK